MEYSFTVTRNYVKSWTYIEGIRELLQNAYDFGNESIKVDHDERCISISNKDDVLDIKTLLLGYGTKAVSSDKIGGFGEGFLLALLVLIREGLAVTIQNGNDVWKPFFKYIEAYDEDLLSIKIEKDVNQSNDLNIIVSNFSSYQLQKIEQTFLKLGNPYNSIKTLYGEILLDPCQKGKMYVEGLPITSDDNYTYGYNFNASCVKLDRDRKEINTYELKTITANSLASMKDFDFKLIDDLVISGGDDAKYIIGEDIEFSDEFTYGYSDFLKEKYKIEADSVVTTKSNTDVIDELKHQGEKVITVDKKVQANIINKVSDYSANRLSEVSDKIKKRSNLDCAWDEYNRSSYKLLKGWYKDYCHDLPIKAKETFDEILTDLEPYNFNLIRKNIND